MNPKWSERMHNPPQPRLTVAEAAREQHYPYWWTPEGEATSEQVNEIIHASTSGHRVAPNWYLVRIEGKIPVYLDGDEMLHREQTQPAEPMHAPDYLTALCEVEDALHTMEVICDDLNIPYPKWFVAALDGVRNDIMKVEAGTNLED